MARRGRPPLRRTARFELAPARRPQSRLRLRLPWRRLGVLVVTLAALGGAAYGATWLVLGDSLRVRSVTVVGAQIVDPRAVATAADVAGDSLLTLDDGAAAERVAALPAVRSATVHRDWPRGVVIDVTEHQGWGYWQASGVRLVIDVEGNVHERARPPAADAPTIVEIGPSSESGVMAPDPDTVLLIDRLLREHAFDRLRVTPSGFLFSRDRGLTVLIEGGPDAVLGDSSSYDFKVAAWGALLDRIEQEQLEVSEIDLRFGKHLVMR